MNKLGIRGVVASMVFLAAPAAAVSPTTPATANVKIYKPLTIAFVQNLDFGVIVLNSGTWNGQIVSIAQNGTLSCGSGNVTCSGSTQVAKYHLTGTNNATATVSCPPFNMLSGGNTIAFTCNAPTSVALGATGLTTGVDFSIGGTITLNSTTPEGVYSGNFAVTADYQ